MTVLYIEVSIKFPERVLIIWNNIFICKDPILSCIIEARRMTDTVITICLLKKTAVIFSLSERVETINFNRSNIFISLEVDREDQNDCFVRAEPIDLVGMNTAVRRARTIKTCIPSTKL